MFKLTLKITVSVLVGWVVVSSILIFSSVWKVDSFCDKVKLSMDVDEVQQLAKSESVELRWLHGVSKIPNYYVIAAVSKFTIGEHACRIEVKDRRVIKVHSGTFSPR
jgi:hypothetical protein